LRAFGTLIQDVHLNVQSILVSASREFVDDVGLNMPDSSFPGDEFARSSRKCSNYHLYDLYVERELKLANADKQHIHHEHFRDMGVTPGAAATLKRPHTAGAVNRRVSDEIGRIRWTMAAIRRRRCAQLARFAQMVVFIELDAFEALVRRNGEMVLQNVLRGANAAVIRRLTDPGVYELALRAMAKELQREPASTAGKAGPAAGCADAQMVTRQQLKRLLRSIWEPITSHFVVGNQRRESMTDDPGGSNEIWDQSKFEIAFCQALAIVKEPDDPHTSFDSFTAEEIICVVGTVISDALVLQPFHGDTIELFREEDSGAKHNSLTAMEIGDQIGPDALLDDIDEEGLPSRLRAIGSIAPTPLFSLQLELWETRTGDYEIRINPSIDAVVASVQDVLGSFLELFKALPSLVSHPNLRAVLNFAENLLASALTIDFAVTEEDSSFITAGADRPEAATNSALENETEEMDALSIFARLEERMQTDSHYQETCSGVVGLSSSTMKAITALASRYLVFLERHIHNEAVDFDEKARCFRSGVYQLCHISDDILDFQEQVATKSQLLV
jgi:hypothetical protein